MHITFDFSFLVAYAGAGTDAGRAALQLEKEQKAALIERKPKRIYLIRYR